MRKVIILGLVALLLTVFTYFALFYVSSSERSKLTNELNEDMAEQAPVDETPAEPRSGVGTLKSLRQLGENVECTIVYSPEGQDVPVEGTYFVSEGNIRGDFLTDSPDLSGKILSSMIVEDATMYMWSEIDGEVYGMKMSLSEAGDSETDTNVPVSLNDDVNYTCKPWKDVDNSIFVPPGDVLFQDLNDLMKAGFEEGVIYEEGEVSF